MDLQEIRGKLDEIDAQLVRLLEERLALSAEVAEYKIGTGKPVLDRAREEQKIAAVRGLAHTEYAKNAAAEMMTQLMTVGRRLQYGIMQEHGQSQVFT